MSANTTKKKSSSSNWKITLAIVALIILIAVFPFIFNTGDKNSDEKFGGSDDAATDEIESIDPNYHQWFEPLVGELPGEVESGLFAFQAAVGSGIVCYVLGVYRGRSKARNEAEEANRSEVASS